MKFFVLISLVCAAQSLLATFQGVAGRLSSEQHWKVYKSKYNKVYVDSSEESMRKWLFLERRESIERHNAEMANELGFKLGYSHLTDWTSQELAKLNGLIVGKEGVDKKELATKLSSQAMSQPDFLKGMLSVPLENLPKEVDWRKTAGRVTQVKDQGRCGSCWAFSTTGVLEGQQYRVRNTSQELIPLSEQDLVACSVENFGCKGGLPEWALRDMAATGGIESEKDYPYWSGNGTDDENCKFTRSKSVMTVKGFHDLDGTEASLQKVVAQYGPVAISIFVSDNFISYKSGVLTKDWCPYFKDPNHAVLAVGYGTDPKQGDYWLVKNSWSSDWGEDGYIKMARNKDNFCLIGKHATIPVF